MKLNFKKLIKNHHKFKKIHNKNKNNTCKNNNGDKNEQQFIDCKDNQDIEKTQILVSKEFDSQIIDLQNELEKTKDDIKNMKNLGTQLKTSGINSNRLYEINKSINELILAIVSRLRNIGMQLISLDNNIKSKPKDKNTNICIFIQRKLANDLKQTLNEFNKIKEENKYESYNMFRQQYKTRNINATEIEVQKDFERRYGSPDFVQKLDATHQTFKESQGGNDEIKNIEQSIEELFNVFKDTQTMLITQNDTLISIEENTDNTEVKVNQGSNEMAKVIKIRKNSRK
eukprot:jgi/Orpsp1_1/1176544/evm.model.c7180000058007.1